MRRSARRGYSLVEILVVLCLISTILLLSTRLLDHGLRVLGKIGHDPANGKRTTAARGRLRADLQRSTHTNATAAWSQGPLQADDVTYRLRGRDLVRCEGGSCTPVVRGVDGFRFRAETPALVVVELGTDRPDVLWITRRLAREGGW